MYVRTDRRTHIAKKATHTLKIIVKYVLGKAIFNTKTFYFFNNLFCVAADVEYIKYTDK